MSTALSPICDNCGHDDLKIVGRDLQCQRCLHIVFYNDAYQAPENKHEA